MIGGAKAREILEKAQAGGYALGAFNAVNLETLKAIAEAAKKMKAPVIIETSAGEARYAGIERMRLLVDSFIEETGIPMILNFDHGKTIEECIEAIQVGQYDYIHFDGSELPYEENEAKSKQVAEAAHAAGLLMEAEVGYIIQGSELREYMSVAEARKQGAMTDPQVAKKFVQATSLDTLAVFIGNVHGKYATEKRGFDFELLKKLREELPCFFSLHGGSDTDDEEMRRVIKTGRIVKVNINTDLRLAFKEALKEKLQTSDELAFYKLAPDAIEAMQKVVEHKIDVFGSAGKA